MVVAELKIESVKKVKNNPYYGDYEIRHVETRTIVNQKYEGLVSPEKGIMLTFKCMDGDRLTITIDRHYFMGLTPMEVDKDSTFSTSFAHNGRIYEVNVNTKGELEYMCEWASYYEFEEGYEPDNEFTKHSKKVKWELSEK